MSGQGDSLGIVQKVLIWSYEQMVYVQSRIRPGKWYAQTSLEFWYKVWDTKWSPDLSQTDRPCDSQQKKKQTCWIVYFAVPADHMVKLKEIKKRDKYQNLTREPKKLWNMKVMVIPTIIGVLSTFTKGLVQWLADLEINY